MIHGVALGGAIAVCAALLFLGYLRVSWTVAATSDGAAQALQARDMLAGNWLLHGWMLGDVSFYTTELPEYVLVELIRPLGPSVIHVAAALTYTLLVLAAFALARGRAVRRDGLVRGLVAAGIMLAPQLGYGAFVLLLSPDHVGTQVPLLLGWLLLDLAPRRWWVPAVLCLLLAWVQFADRVAVLTAVLPLIVVCSVTVVRTVRGERPVTATADLAGGPAKPERAWRYELALIGAAIVSVGLSWAAARLLSAAGGYAAHPLPLTLAPLGLLWTHAWLAGWGILELYGANFLGVAGWAGLTFATLHLVGLAVGVAGFAVALGRFLWRGRGARGPAAAGTGTEPSATRPPQLPESGAQTRARHAGSGGGGELLDSVLAVAIVANLLSYVLSIEPGTVLGTGYDAREIAALLPLGAVLAGRVFGPGISAVLLSVTGRAEHAVPADPGGRLQETGGAKTRLRSISSALAVCLFFVVLAGGAVDLGYSAAQGAVPGQDSVLADWLVAHGLRYGLGGPSANVVTVDSGGRVMVTGITVRRGRVSPLLYQSTSAAYEPRVHDATFLVTGTPADGAEYAAETVPQAAARATFGPPARMYRFDGYTVCVWDVNLLTKLRE